LDQFPEHRPEQPACVRSVRFDVNPLVLFQFQTSALRVDEGFVCGNLKVYEVRRWTGSRFDHCIERSNVSPIQILRFRQ
jgi:hypothetical protein